MNKFEFTPSDYAGWYTCISCSVDVHETIIYIPTITDDLNVDYFCSEGCYLDHVQDNQDDG